MFVHNFQDALCDMVTVLPEGSQDIDPKDQDTLRYAARTNGQSGFLFLNNYEDLSECKKKEGEEITVVFADEEFVIRDISLAPGEEAVLPLRMDVEGIMLLYAKAQPISALREKERTTYFFFAPEGMKAE